jgi:phage terminase large subunit
MELTTRLWKRDNKSRRIVERKEDYKKRGYKSPDLADAHILCFYITGARLPDKTEEEKDKDRKTILAGNVVKRQF